ncbi:MAG: hypothetical protein ACK55Z_20075, partial [bacterium]
RQLHRGGEEPRPPRPASRRRGRPSVERAGAPRQRLLGPRRGRAARHPGYARGRRSAGAGHLGELRRPPRGTPDRLRSHEAHAGPRTLDRPADGDRVGPAGHPAVHAGVPQGLRTATGVTAAGGAAPAPAPRTGNRRKHRLRSRG